MADTSNLTNFLGDIADAIRTKKGTTENIPAADFDVEIASIETGNATSDVKLFETQEEMQSDENPKEGDLAVVYRQEIQNFQEDTVTQFMTFPETVTLDEAYTGDASGTLRSVDSSSSYFDGYVQLHKTSFRFDGIRESERIRVQYTSTDGITYTRLSMTPNTNPINFGVEVKWEQREPFIPQFGKFMLIDGNIFEGLFEYDDKHISATDFALLPTSGINITDKTYIGEPVGRYNINDISIVVKAIKAELGLSVDMSMNFGTMDGKPIVCFFVNNNKTYVYNNYFCYDRTNQKYQIASSWNYAGNVYVYQLDLVNHTYTLVSNIPKTSGYFYVDVPGNLDSLFVNAGLTKDAFSTDSSTPTYIRTSENGQDAANISFSGDDIKTNLYLPDPKYLYASTQLSLSEANQLLPGIIGYGENGVVTGDGTIYDVLNEITLLKTVTDIDSTDVNAYGYIGDVFSRLVYLTRQSKGRYVLGRTEVNDKSWRYQSKDGSVVCEELSSSDFTVKKDGQLVFQLSDNVGKGYNWASNSTNEVFYVDDDRLAIFNKSARIKNSVGSGLNIFKVDMRTGETTLVATDDFFTVPSTNYVNIESGSSKYGLAFITASIIKTNSPYNNYSGVKFYDAVYDKVVVIEDTQTTSNSNNTNYVCPLLASTNDPRYLLICTRCYTTNNNRTTKLYRYDRETGEKELINTYNSNISIGTSDGYNLGIAYETTDYIYLRGSRSSMYRFAKNSSYSVDLYATNAAEIAYSVNHRLLNSDVYNTSKGVIYRFTSTNNEPQFEVIDTLNLSSNNASMNGKSYGPLYATIITNDIVKTIDTTYSKNSAMELQRYELSDKYNADTIAVNTSHSSAMHTTFILTKDNTSSGPMSQDEYDQALNTANEIKGGNI